MIGKDKEIEAGVGYRSANPTFIRESTRLERKAADCHISL